MKKNLLVLIMMLSTIAGYAQTYKPINVMVWSAPGVGVAGQKVWVKAFQGFGRVYESEGWTDSTSFGLYTDSIDASIVFDSLVLYTADCNGNRVRGNATPIAPNAFGYEDTIYQPCAMNALGGKAGITYKQSTTTPNALDFTNTSILSGLTGNILYTFIYFGDGDSATGTGILNHTYPAPGKYYLEFNFAEYDSATFGNKYNSSNWYRDTVEVLPFNPSSFCKSEYFIDTVNSGNGVVLIYNNSLPAIADSNYSTSYHWDFGDGDSSNQAFPSHTYQAAGLYNVCLTITSMDSVGATCTSTFCDSLGVDTSGNVIYKNSGFQLKVLNPALSIDDHKVNSLYKIYPNPVNSYLNVELHSNEALKSYKILDLKGSVLVESTLESDVEELRIDVSKYNSGVYILQLENSAGVFSFHKFLKY